MNDDRGSKLAVFVNHNIGMKGHAVSDFGVLTDKDIASDNASIADFNTLRDDGKRLNRDLPADLC